MIRYFIQLSYKGTHFHGWQYQSNAITVQEIVTNALNTLIRQEITLVGAGRTDTGVHASFFIAHFDTNLDDLDTNNLCYRLNGILPEDIVINKIFRVKPHIHSRFNATYRTYCYNILLKKNPFEREFAYYLSKVPDIKAMNQACKCLFAYSDFTSFSKTHTDTKTNNCKIMFAKWKEDGDKIIFTITADRFLRNMIRAIVGTLIEVSCGKIDIEQFKNIIKSKDRKKAGISVPARGLFLTDIGYPSNYLLPED